MNNIICKRLLKMNFFLLIVLLSFGQEAIGQSRFPAILLGEGTLDEITQLPGYPASDFVAVQFCGLRDKCMITTFYVDKLKAQGIDISFFPVFDRIQESMKIMSNAFPIKATIDWGMHVTPAVAEQVYILDKNRKVVYQGTLKNLDDSILTTVASGSASSAEFTRLIDQLPIVNGGSKGIWLYRGNLYPMQLKMKDFLTTSIRGALVVYTDEIGNKSLPNTPYQKNHLISSFLQNLGYTITTEKSQRYYLRVTGLEETTNESSSIGRISWLDLIKSLTIEKGIIINNFNELPPSLTNTLTEHLDNTLSPFKTLEHLKAAGLKFQVESTEEINLIKIN